jgi:hypothetical protein
MIALAHSQESAAQLAAWKEGRQPSSISGTRRAGGTSPPKPISRRPYSYASLASRPELQATIERVDAATSPTFMQYADLAPWWPVVYGTFPEYQLVLADANSGQHFAHGNMLPFSWDGTTKGLPQSAVELVRRALDDRRRGAHPTALGVLQIVVNPSGHASEVARRMQGVLTAFATAIQVTDLLVAVRPADAPNRSLDARREHLKSVAGGTPLGLIDAWRTVSADLDEWLSWTGVAAPASGEYLVPGALTPIEVDTSEEIGVYVEPRVWMRFRIG